MTTCNQWAEAGSKATLDKFIPDWLAEPRDDEEPDVAALLVQVQAFAAATSSAPRIRVKGE